MTRKWAGYYGTVAQEYGPAPEWSVLAVVSACLHVVYLLLLREVRQCCVRELVARFLFSGIRGSMTRVDRPRASEPSVIVAHNLGWNPQRCSMTQGCRAWQLPGIKCWGRMREWHRVLQVRSACRSPLLRSQRWPDRLSSNFLGPCPQ